MNPVVEKGIPIPRAFKKRGSPWAMFPWEGLIVGDAIKFEATNCSGIKKYAKSRGYTILVKQIGKGVYRLWILEVNGISQEVAR